MAVSIQGVDASYDPPTVAELRAAGKRFICRYVSIPGHAKNLTRAEADRYTAAGISIVLVGEISPGRAMGGYSQGKTDMASFMAQATELGAPADVPIIMAVDFDVLAVAEGIRAATLGHRELAARLADMPGLAAQGDPKALADFGREGAKTLALRAQLRAGQMTTVLAYVQGGASVVGYRRTGPYGEFDVIEANAKAKVGYYGWQTYAWSGGRWSAAAQLQQYRNNIPLGSGTVDLDRATAADYGQWGGQARAGWWAKPLGPAELAQMRAAFEGALGGF